MKTKVLIISALMFAGLLLSSCTKDNDLFESDALEQSAVKDNYVEDKAESDFTIEFGNYPDPFANSTSIRYHLVRSNFVQLEFYKAGSKKRTLLVKQYQRPGIHSVKLDGSKLEAGKYIAELKIGDKVYTDTMSKMNWVDDDSTTMIDD